jgi:O-antigen ligase
VALAVLAVGPVLIAWQIGAIWGLLATVAAAYGVGAFLMVVFANGWTLPEVLDIVVGDPTFTGRTDIWAFASTEIGARPWLGSGYGAFWDVGPDDDPLQRAPFGSWLRHTEVGVINQAHSGYLDLPLQIGIPATVVAAAVVLRAWWLAGHLAVRAPLSSNARIIGVFGFLFCAVFLAHNFMEATLFNRGQMLCNISLLVFFLLEREAADMAAPTAATPRPAPRTAPSVAFGRRLREHRRRRPRGTAIATTPNGGPHV